MRFVLTADIPDQVHEPGIPLAQVLREIAPVLETANPLVSGKLLDRLTAETRAEWTLYGGVPLGTAPIITSYAPNPGPVGSGSFGFNLTGNFFPPKAVAVFDGVMADTSVYSSWTITGNAPMRSQPGICKVMLMNDGIGYAHFDWVFAAAAEAAPLPA